MNTTAIVIAAINTAGIIVVALIGLVAQRNVRSDIAAVHHDVRRNEVPPPG